MQNSTNTNGKTRGMKVKTAAPITNAHILVGGNNPICVPWPYC